MTEFQEVLTDWNWASPAWLALAGFLVVDTVVNGWRSGTRLGLWLAAVAAFVLAYVSPVGVLADGALFSAHIIQHLLLMLIIPLCYVLSIPGVGSLFQVGPQPPSSPEIDTGRSEKDSRPRPSTHVVKSRNSFPLAAYLAALLSVPQIGWACGLGAMWFWHVPSLCHAAAQSAALGSVRDISLLIAGTAFWWPVFSPARTRRLSPPLASLYLFTACLGCSLLGVYITFTPVTVCPIFAHPVEHLGAVRIFRNWGFTARADQQLGGLLMWVPPCLVYGGAILSLLRTWYAPSANATTNPFLSPRPALSSSTNTGGERVRVRGSSND